MDFEMDPGSKTAKVTLSRSNLLSMLSKLDHMGDSALTIMREVDNGWTLVFKGERDEDHYKGRVRGKMHPLTERYLNAEDS